MTQQAAAEIRTDFEEKIHPVRERYAFGATSVACSDFFLSGFIRAEIIFWEDLLKAGSFASAREK